MTWDVGAIPVSAAFQHYVRLLDELLWKHSFGSLDDEEEERFAVALNDCRREMTPHEVARIAEIIARRT